MEWNNDHKRIVYFSSIIVMIALTGAFLRIHHLGEKEYNQDELFSIHRSSLPVQEIIGSAGNEPHPPLYYLMLHFWMGLFGDSEIATRALSLVLGIVSLFLMYHLGALLFDRGTGIIASLMLSLSTFHITYSQESRMYSLMAMLTLASLFFFIKMTRERSVQVTGGYLLFSMLLMYSHIYGLFIVLAQNLYVLATSLTRIKQKPQFSIKQWLVLQALLAALFIPWTVVLVHQIMGIKEGLFVNLNWLPEPQWSDLLGTFSLFSYYDPVTLTLFSLLALSAMLKQQKEGHTCFLILWLFIPILVPFIISHLAFPIFLPKYTIAASLAFYVLASRGISQISNVYLKGAVLATMVFWSFNGIMYNY